MRFAIDFNFRCIKVIYMFFPDMTFTTRQVLTAEIGLFALFAGFCVSFASIKIITGSFHIIHPVMILLVGIFYAFITYVIYRLLMNTTLEYLHSRFDLHIKVA